MGRIMVALVSLALVALLALPSVDAAAPDPASVIDALDAALSAGNVDQALMLWDANGVAKLLPAPPGTTGVFTGTAQLRAWMESLVAQHLHLEVTTPRQVMGNHVTWSNKLSLDPWRALGIAPLAELSEATVQDGKIISFSTTLTPESITRLQQATAAPTAAPRTGEGGMAAYLRRLGDG